MISKGVDCFIYLGNPHCKGVVDSRGNGEMKFDFRPAHNSGLGVMQKHHCEIDISSVWLEGEKTGRLELEVFGEESILLSKYAEINPLTGNLGDSNLSSMLETPSVVEEKYSVSYGFCDAPAGKSHQAYIYATRNHANWMGDLVGSEPLLKGKPFETFALPGSHNAGMFTGVASSEEAKNLISSILKDYIKDPKVFVETLIMLRIIPVDLVLPVLIPALVYWKTSDAARRGLVNLSYTQKDDTNTQLELGVRYFDFRPGYNVCSDGQQQRFQYHQHYFIPGCKFRDFLSDVVKFLESHKKEIVVININYSGFYEETMEPERSNIDYVINSVLSKSKIEIGGIDDLRKTLGDLIFNKTRLIILYNSSGLDSYSDGAYATNDAESIITALDCTLQKALEFQKLSCPSQIEKENWKWTVLQLQGTYTRTSEGIREALLTTSDASSPLLFTKAKFDYRTYTWISQSGNVALRCGSKLLVLLNDFADNALVDHAIHITKQRLTSLFSNK